MVHLTEKPVELAVRAMQYSSRAGENVLDLFGGSGSTLIAAEQTGRKAFLMELDPLYCDVIVAAVGEVHGPKGDARCGRGGGRVIYLASPYTHSDASVRESRFDAACQATAELVRSGQVVFSPIAHGHPLVRFGLPIEWEYWARFDREYLRRCDEWSC